MPPKKRPCFQEVEFGHQQKGSVFIACVFVVLLPCKNQSLNHMKSYGCFRK